MPANADCDDAAARQGDDLISPVDDEGAGQTACPEARKLADMGIVSEGKNVDGKALSDLVRERLAKLV